MVRWAAHSVQTTVGYNRGGSQHVEQVMNAEQQIIRVAGQMIGNYRIERLLGRGGMGAVFHAYDTRLHRPVALKILTRPPDDDTADTRLLREARNAAGLNHPNVCTIYEVGEANGAAFIAMEYVEGRALDVRLRDGPLGVDEAIRYGVQAADALAYAHDHGVVHRDFKAANAIVTDAGRLKVVDFGLARRADPLMTNTTMTSSLAGGVAGTPYAMAPEQLRGEPADARTDIWALGVLLYEMVAGTKPFKAPTLPALFSSILSDPPEPLPQKVPATSGAVIARRLEKDPERRADDVPVTLRAVIDRCLEKQPARRYQHAGEVRAALEAIQAGTTTYGTTLGYRLARRPWLTAAAAVLVLAGVMAALNLQQIRTRWLGGEPRIESLAVLPLENLSGDSAQDYFADGMTEVLSTDLARLGGLRRVTARGSVMRYKGTGKPLADIARELNVDALVTGSVLRSGDRVSITAQLLDPATGDQLWTNRYERDLQDVLVLRNEIVSAIVREINAQLSPGEQARLASARPVNREAFESYLKGRFHWYKQTREDYDLAERYFQLALEKDPNYALGYAGMASVWFMRGDAGFQPPSETFPKAAAFMTRALELDDNVAAELYVALGNHKAIQWDWAGAEREYKRAIDVNPNLADARFFYCDLLLTLKRPEEWQREVQRALELDPLNEFHRSYYGWQLNYQHRYDEAIPIFQKLLPTGPNKAANYLGLWGAYYRKGMYNEALIAAKEYFVAAGDREFADALGAGRDAAAYRAAMRRAADVMVARSKERHVPAIRVARMFAHAGDNDSAIHWLERAYENREPAMMRLGLFWDWDDLRSDPRFQDLLRRMNLPQ